MERTPLHNKIHPPQHLTTPIRLTHTTHNHRCRGSRRNGLDGGGDTALEDLTLADAPLVVVTGAEGAGLSRLVRQTCDVIASIPISRAVESLNAAVATGIGLYEIDRLRRAARSAQPAQSVRPDRG